MSKRNYLFSIILLFTSACSAKNYSYLAMGEFELNVQPEDISYYQNKITIDTELRKVYSGHSFYPYESCSDKKWLCVFSDVINFAIHKNDFANQDSWEKKGFKFINKGQGINYEGKNDGIFRIVASKEGFNTNVILYSKQRGIIGINIIYSDQVESFWLLNTTGFNME